MMFLLILILTGSIPRGDECTLSSADQDEVTRPFSKAKGRVRCQKPDTDEEKEHIQTEVKKSCVPSTVFFVACTSCFILNAVFL